LIIHKALRMDEYRETVYEMNRKEHNGLSAGAIREDFTTAALRIIYDTIC
jgi:hypothetical protein